MNKILIAVATYNERENLPDLLAAIARTVPEADILVVDDNSPDGTGEWADDFAREHGFVRVIHRTGKLGLGTAVIAVMRYAIENQYEWLINMDADFSHPVERLPDLIEKAQQTDENGVYRFDTVVGSRYTAGGGIKGWPWFRRFMSLGVNAYARVMLGLSVRDTSGAYRCYRVSTLKKLDFSDVESTGYSFFEEILWRLKRVGARFAETPILFTDRVRGQSKINKKEAASALRILLDLGGLNWVGIRGLTIFQRLIQTVCVLYSLLLVALLVAPDPYFLFYGIPDPHDETSKFDSLIHAYVFIPFGILWQWGFFSFQSAKKQTIFWTLLTAIALLLEAVQIYIPGRTYDPIDLAQNGVGTCLGLILAAGITYWMSKLGFIQSSVSVQQPK